MENRNEILLKIRQLMEAYQKGLLGGEKMPEHENQILMLYGNAQTDYFKMLQSSLIVPRYYQCRKVCCKNN